MINTFGSILMRATTVQESAWSVAKHAIGKLGYVDCIVYLINDDGELYQSAAHGNKNPAAQDILNPIKLKMGEGICGYVAQSGIGEVIGDTSKDARYQVDDKNRSSEIAVPVLSDGVVIGIIDSEHPDKDYFSDHDLDILNTIASMLSVKISQAKAIEELANHKVSLELRVEERTRELRANEVKLEKSLSKEKQRTIALRTSEKKLQISLLKEKELGDLKTSFVSTASHQFRTPLAIIQSNVELLEMLANSDTKQEPEKYKKVTGRIKGGITKMTDLMNDVLILGKLTSGNVRYTPEDVDMVEFFEQLAEEFNAVQLDGRSINVVTDGEAYKMQLDPKLLTHSFSNLISNAFKYSVGKENPQLIIHFKTNELVVSIKDYGMGIPEAGLSKLFQPFFRADNVTEMQGTGLGLSIAKEYTEINKGKIAATSILGEGSCFEIRFKRLKKIV